MSVQLTMPDEIGFPFENVLSELERAQAKFPPFNSAHEGYAVILEELEELKDEVFWGPRARPVHVEDGETRETARICLMRAEAIQVAAMAIRFIQDVCDK